LKQANEREGLVKREVALIKKKGGNSPKIFMGACKRCIISDQQYVIDSGAQKKERESNLTK